MFSWFTPEAPGSVDDAIEVLSSAIVKLKNVLEFERANAVAAQVEHLRADKEATRAKRIIDKLEDILA